MADQSYYIDGDTGSTIILTDEQASLLRESVLTRDETLDEFHHILNGLNLMWLMIVSIFLFMMQVGFAFMASGAANQKNSASILTNHLMLICTCGVVYFCISSEIISEANGGLVGEPKEL